MAAKATSQLQIGDLVELKSGGPRMVIRMLLSEDGLESGAPQNAVCNWVAAEVTMTRIFPLKTLKKAKRQT